MRKTAPRQLKAIIECLNALPCWHVSCGESVGASFQIALGGRVPRALPLKNTYHPKAYRDNEGEANLLVWCSWRLDAKNEPLTSSDDTLPGIKKGLSKLVGAEVKSVEMTAPAWDLAIQFSGSLSLAIFCDHVPGDPSMDGNWDLFTRELSLFVGPGASYQIKKPGMVGRTAPRQTKAM